ncbi:MAG: DUF4854 domain-containing protein [Streptococcaceae bacterium]|jgi:hypothetical protein|nr:DUF4854 domain-containing protein [Streptococcaceae bacterium]
MENSTEEISRINESSGSELETAQLTNEALPEEEPAKQSEKSRVLGILAIVFGGLGILLAFTLLFGLLFGLAALVLGIVGLVKNSKRKRPLALTGFILSLVALVTTVLFLVLYVSVGHQALLKWEQGLPSNGLTTPSSSQSSSEATSSGIQKFVADNQASIEQMKSGFGGMISDVTLTAQGDNTAVYTLKFGSSVTDDEASAMKQAMDAEKSVMTKELAPELTQMTNKYGILNPSIVVVYETADGTVIDRITVTSSSSNATT